ncbi:hypothetical protein [Bacillus sp. OTU530]|uniref:hypothetical protein n=1 Tax=Bacillus sp. OTU530 TaxID=3043862 RepID=UPI00313E3D0F
MEEKSVFFDLDRTKIAKRHEVPDTKMTDDFVIVSYTEDMILNNLMGVGCSKGASRAQRLNNEKVSKNAQTCKKGCKGCKMRLKKETFDIVS